MSATFYVNGVTVIDAAPMNDYDSACYDNLGDGTNYTGVLAVARMASVYQYTAWDPSDVAGTLTNAPATAAATSTATSYITAANSSGTVTFTCVKAGQYRAGILQKNEVAAAATALNMVAVIGGTATFLMGTPTQLTQMAMNAGGFSNQSGFSQFYVTMTAGQTVTILPKVSVTSGGVTTNFTNECTISIEYTGT